MIDSVILILIFLLFVFLIYKIFSKIPYFAFTIALPSLFTIPLIYVAFRYIYLISILALLFPLFFLYYPKDQRKQYEKIYTKTVFILDSFFLLLPILSELDWFHTLFVIAKGEAEIAVFVGPIGFVFYGAIYHMVIWKLISSEKQNQKS